MKNGIENTIRYSYKVLYNIHKLLGFNKSYYTIELICIMKYVIKTVFIRYSTFQVCIKGGLCGEHYEFLISTIKVSNH